MKRIINLNVRPNVVNVEELRISNEALIDRCEHLYYSMLPDIDDAVTKTMLIAVLKFTDKLHLKYGSLLEKAKTQQYTVALKYNWGKFNHGWTLYLDLGNASVGYEELLNEYVEWDSIEEIPHEDLMTIAER